MQNTCSREECRPREQAVQGTAVARPPQKPEEEEELGSGRDLQTSLLLLPSARMLHWLHPKETQECENASTRAANPGSEGGWTLTRDKVGHGVGGHKQGPLHPK